MNASLLPPFLIHDRELIITASDRRLQERPVVERIVQFYLANRDDRATFVTLCLAAAACGHYDFGRVSPAAGAAALIRAAMRVHDPLVNEGDRRDGRVSSHADWGGDAGLMVGDYLLALAAAEMAEAPDNRIIALYAQAVMRFSEGQLAPVTVVVPEDAAVAQYLARAASERAALASAACQAGAICGGLDDAAMAALAAYGEAFGIAAQIAADLHDLAQVELRELREGAITLPLIYAASGESLDRLSVLLDRSASPHARATARTALEASGAVDRAHADLAAYVERAQQALAVFAASPARAILQQLAAALHSGSIGPG